MDLSPDIVDKTILTGQGNTKINSVLSTTFSYDAADTYVTASQEAIRADLSALEEFLNPFPEHYSAYKKDHRSFLNPSPQVLDKISVETSTYNTAPGDFAKAVKTKWGGDETKLTTMFAKPSYKVELSGHHTYMIFNVPFVVLQKLVLLKQFESGHKMKMFYNMAELIQCLYDTGLIRSKLSGKGAFTLMPTKLNSHGALSWFQLNYKFRDLFIFDLRSVDQEDITDHLIKVREYQSYLDFFKELEVEAQKSLGKAIKDKETIKDIPALTGEVNLTWS